MAFVPELASIPNMASSMAVNIYEALIPPRSDLSKCSRQIELFRTARHRPRGPPRPRVCANNHPLLLVIGNQIKFGAPVPVILCSLCGDRCPTTFGHWNCASCKHSVCPGCMPLPSPQDEALYMYYTICATIPDDFKLLKSWGPLQELQRLAHCRTRTVCERRGRYYLPFEVRFHLLKAAVVLCCSLPDPITIQSR